MKNKKPSVRIWLLLASLIIYFTLFVFNKEIFVSSSKFFLENIRRIIPALFFVFIIMTLANYFITPKKILNLSMKKGARKWLLMSLAGIFSVGAPFLWYPLLRNLKKQGLSNGLITTYLYNRCVVISFVPLLIFYFSLKYVIVLYAVITASALVQGIIIDSFFND